MSDQPETLSAILAEMRAELDCIDDTKVIPVVYIKNSLPRIEAAYKREHAEWHAETDAAKEARNRIACKMRYEFAAKCRACKAEPGNAAALREALERIVRYEDGIVGCIESGHASGVDWDGITFAMIQTAKEALSAPARNCDRPFRSTNEAIGAYVGERGDGPHLGYCDAIKWALAPAKGGAK